MKKVKNRVNLYCLYIFLRDILTLKECSKPNIKSRFSLTYILLLEDSCMTDNEHTDPENMVLYSPKRKIATPIF